MFLLPKSYWEVRRTKKKGRGVFALKDIEAGTIIGDYLGRVIPADKEENYESRLGFYTMYYKESASIFPNPKKDGIHIINHSCAPNCWMYTYKGHTLYFSIRKIFKNEELTISYLLGPQDKDCKPCKDICKCESFNCSQTMHMPKKKFDVWVAFDDKKAETTKFQRIRYNKDLPPLISYPKKISDNRIYTLIGSQTKKAASFKDKKLPKIPEVRARIRETGRYLSFPNLNLIIRGVSDNLLISQVT